MLKKLCILLPLECDLNLVITSEASHVVNSCSFMGIILFPYFNSTKGVKKTVASGNSRIRSAFYTEGTHGGYFTAELCRHYDEKSVFENVL